MAQSDRACWPLVAIMHCSAYLSYDQRILHCGSQVLIFQTHVVLLVGYCVLIGILQAEQFLLGEVQRSKTKAWPAYKQSQQ